VSRMHWQGLGDLRWLGDDSAPTAVVMRRLGRWRWQVGGLRDLKRRRVGYADSLDEAKRAAEVALDAVGGEG
jgi:hypothetical protein